MKDEISTQVPKQALRKTDVSGSYIRIEIVDYFGAKKVIEVKPYFDKQQLTEIEFLNAIRLLEEEKNKATFEYWRRSGLIPLKLIRSTNVDATTNVHTKH